MHRARWPCNFLTALPGDRVPPFLKERERERESEGGREGWREGGRDGGREGD